MTELPTNDLELAATIIKNFPPSLIPTVGSALNWATDKVKQVFRSGFSAHLESTKRKCTYIRTIDNPGEVTDISDIYVNLYLGGRGDTFKEEELLQKTNIHHLIIIVGTGGAGKSMMMRYLALQAMSTQYEQVPLFIDLKDLDDPTKATFLDSLFNLISTGTDANSRLLFDKAILAGAFCLFLDGLDEVGPNQREEVRRQISDLARHAPKLKMIVSSRPDIDFLGWDNFSIYNIVPLTNNQTIAVIEQSQHHDSFIKSDFLKRLQDGSFSSYQSFLEIPLLAIILLMSYEEHLELSDTATSFYEQAYEVLYRRHDRTKGLLRKSFSGLAREDFRKVLSAFCYKSLVDNHISFTEEELSYYFSRACAITELTADPTALSVDIVESVSLMQRDGLKIYFIHRSFQEYFAAYFVTRFKGDHTFRVYDALLCGRMSASVGSMIAELDLLGLERDWCKPVLDALVSDLVQPRPNQLSHVLKKAI